MIPEAAVEAAARALTAEVYGTDMFDGMSDASQDILRRRGKFILEAAAPHMLAEAWDAGAERPSTHGHSHRQAQATRRIPPGLTAGPEGALKALCSKPESSCRWCGLAA